MQLTDKSHLRAILRSLEASAKRSLGQHFLVDSDALASIITAAELTSSDTVVEVGPGLGTLTEALLTADKVITVEKDDLFAKRLTTALASPDNLELIHADVLQTNLAGTVEPGEYKVVANIPYYLTSPLIRYFLEEAPQPKLLVLLVQKEVADRLAAKPGSMSLLGISAQFYADVEIVKAVPRTSFWPVPKVDSAIVKLTHKPQAYPDESAFFRLVKAGFSSKRKTLLNTLSSGLQLSKEEAEAVLTESNVKSSARAQELAITDWISLTENFTKVHHG
jgi:16S rRNA (adenine1518-N6/adenine1519-N6)-dimethyltransferase